MVERCGKLRVTRLMGLAGQCSRLADAELRMLWEGTERRFK